VNYVHIFIFNPERTRPKKMVAYVFIYEVAKLLATKYSRYHYRYSYRVIWC